MLFYRYSSDIVNLDMVNMKANSGFATFSTLRIAVRANAAALYLLLP